MYKRFPQFVTTHALWIKCISIFIFVVTLLALTNQMGFVRDEGYYFKAAKLYQGWFTEFFHNPQKALTAATMDRYFSYNDEHPGLVKLAMGFSWKLFHDLLGLCAASTALRIPGFIFSALLSILIFLLGRQMFSEPVGILAAGLFLLTPRNFFHAHLGAFDIPVTAMIVLCVWYYRNTIHTKPWTIYFGIFWGLAIATKHNAAFLLPILMLHYYYTHLHHVRTSQEKTKSIWITVPPLPNFIIWSLLLAPVVLYIFYPSAWAHPWQTIYDYYYYHAHHEHYPVEYFGHLYERPPFPILYPFVMTMITAPLPLVVMGCVGVVKTLPAIAWYPMRLWQFHRRFLKKRKRSLLGKIYTLLNELIVKQQPYDKQKRSDLTLLLMNTIWPIGLIALPTVPIFGGVKHWLPAMPFLAILAAWVIVAVAKKFEKLPLWMFMVMALLPGVLGTWYTHPVQTVSYNSLVGGIQGGAAFGMPRTFWGHDARPLFPKLVPQWQQGARVYFDRLNYDSLRAYQSEGLLPSRVRKELSFKGSAQWGVITHMKEFNDNEYRLWTQFKTMSPRYMLAVDGVPIVSVYNRNRL